MRCYLVTGPGAKRYAHTDADARVTREDLVVQLGCKREDVKIEQTDIPTTKEELLEFINSLCADLDEKAAAPTIQPQPKRHPYNVSGSLSEYGVFPECDAQPLEAAQPPSQKSAMDKPIPETVVEAVEGEQQ